MLCGVFCPNAKRELRWGQRLGPVDCNAANVTEETRGVKLEVKCWNNESHRDLRTSFLFLVCDAASLCNWSPTFRDVVDPKRRAPVAQ